ncbi:MAG: cadherin repeat domain-containing protein, partial [Nanoarchaeota archaeon]|nr:cadherin repeat domain-containing protein [Nanoarchaeota archaeon]
MVGLVVLRLTRQLILLVVWVMVLAPSIFALSFSSGPSISPSSNVTTIDSFFCQFTPSGSVLSANITWYRNGILWSGDDQNTTLVSDGVLFKSTPVDTVNTAKSQTWRCQVTLNNATGSVLANSSLLTIINALPIISEISNQTVYEDAAFSLQMNATDPDSDSIVWLSVDQNASDYGGTSLFTISPAGLISFTQTTEDLVGNHSMLILANDIGESGVSGIEVNFELIAVNDAPVLDAGSLLGTCFEASVCNHTVTATDEEGDNLTFTANESFINMSSSGVLNFLPDSLDIGTHLILINVSDGVDWTTGVLNLTINGTNHAPYFTYNSSAVSSGVQNQSTNFTFFVNASDIDPDDTITFSIDSNCSVSNPWSIARLTNGSGSTNASAWINVNFSNSNDFVACRDVIITLSDGSNQTSETFTLNITNSNDAPALHNESYYSENDVSLQFSNNDMSNITLAKGLSFSFRANATDPDELTYEGEILTYSLSGHNASLYQINSSTGLITSVLGVMDDSYVGTTSFTVIATDDQGLFTNATVNITIINNSLPVISLLDNATCVEDVWCYKEFVATDEEGSNLSISFSLNFTSPDNVSVSLSDAQVESFLNITFGSFNGSATNYTLALSPSDQQVGDYVLDVTFTDDFADYSTAQVNFSITNVNDVPYLGDNYSAQFADNLSFPIAAENLPFLKILYAIDGDLYYGQDNLTFNYSFLSGNLSVNLTKINESAASLSFTPSLSDAGNYSINLTVADSTGNFSSKVVNFTVYDSAEAPTITAIKPYLNASNATVEAFTTTLGANNISTIYADENTALTFDVQATDGDNLNMVAAWYEDGVLKSSGLDLNGNSYYAKSFGYNESGVINITVEVTDKGLVTYTWLVTVFDVNQDPLFVHPLTNLTAEASAAITGTQVFADFFRLGSPDNIVFLDPDDDLNSNGYVDNVENNTLTF